MKGIIHSIPTGGQPGRIKLIERHAFYKFDAGSMSKICPISELKEGDSVEFVVAEPESNKFAADVRPAEIVSVVLDNDSDINPEIEAPRSPSFLSANATPAPYTFVPVATGDDGTPLTPLFPAVLHSGLRDNTHTESQTSSGCLKFELHTLTPLLVGQYRYPASGLLDQTSHLFEPDKQCLEPLIVRYGPHGVATTRPPNPTDKTAWTQYRVAIPASSLKGSLRQNIGAMLNAPMERVAEHRYTYRPNLDVKADPQGQRYHCYAAVVVDDDVTRIRLVNKMTNVIFVENPRSSDKDCSEWADDSQYRLIIDALQPGQYCKNIFGYEKDHNRLLYVGVAPPPALGGKYRAYEYRTGIDGDCILATAIKAKATNPNEFRFRHHFRALVNDSDLTVELPLGEVVKRRFEATQEALADDTYGHLGHFPGKEKLKAVLQRVRDNIKRNRICKNQLIFVEVALSDGQPLEVVSFGSHFRYRWRYADTVREILIDPKSGTTMTRPELRAPAGERLGSNPDESQLTGARLLFGFAAAKSGLREKSQGNSEIGTEDFSRFAGRVAINTALEVVTAGKKSSTPTKRFLYTGKGETPADYALPLRILGEPKPSAVEHYLQQQGVEGEHGATRTYGDLPGFESSGVSLNGRKFYRHQPLKIEPGALPPNAPFLGKNAEEILSSQATLAYLVTRPTTVFRFSLRYRELREWELGALLLALCPDLILQVDRNRLDARLIKLIDSASEAASGGEGPRFAIKLGYARPLGFGSAAIFLNSAEILVGRNDLPSIESIRENSEKLLKWQLNAVSAHLTRMNDKGAHLIPLLQALNYAGCISAEYPTLRKKGATEATIYDYHTDIRKLHSKLRRESTGHGVRKDSAIQLT